MSHSVNDNVCRFFLAGLDRQGMCQGSGRSPHKTELWAAGGLRLLRSGCEQVFIMSHSWGDNVFRNFLAWAGEDDEAWAEKHIAHYSNIAGPTLGVPKSVSIFLSGAWPSGSWFGVVGVRALAHKWFKAVRGSIQA